MVPLLKGTVVLMKKNALNYKVIGDTVVKNEGDTILPTLLDHSVGFKLISASKADGNNFFIYQYTLTCKWTFFLDKVGESYIKSMQLF